MISVILQSALTVLVLMTIVWFIALIIKDNSIIDIAWGLGFVLIAWFTFLRFSGQGSKQMLLTLAVTLWGARLALYIWLRKRGKGEDFRYKDFRNRWGKWFFLKSIVYIYMLQGTLMLIIAYPVMKVNALAKQSLSAWDIIGLVIFLAGLLLESVADYQVSRFKKDPANKGKLYTGGVWAWSRHPNYFGEALLWWGIVCFALPLSYGWTTLVSPILITYLLRFFSGVPLLEKKYREYPGFIQYKKKTPVFFPWFK